MSGKRRPSNCTEKGYLIVLVKAIRRRGRAYGKVSMVRTRPDHLLSIGNLSVTEGILMEKGSGTVSGEHDVKEPQTRHQSTDQARLPQFEEWHPGHIKTGLRNRRIGKKVSVRIRPKP